MEMQSRVVASSFQFVATAALAFFLSVAAASAQAPDGPQGTPPVQPNPAPQTAPKQAPPPQQKPQDAGATIAVEVPVVTLDVIATTQHGDLITGLKK
jgi:hypothetical protein